MSRTSSAATLRLFVRFLVTVVVRRLAVAAIPVILVLLVALLSLDTSDLTALLDWQLLVRVFVIVGRIIVSAPASPV